MKPVLLMILDGWGYSKTRDGNAILLAKAPNWNKLWNSYPHTLLKSSGMAVGLPEGTMGNSEVGHLNIGAGRVVYQEYTRINKAIGDGSFFRNETLQKVFTVLKSSGGVLHLMGLCSDVGVHGHLNHLYALADFAVREGVRKISIHCFTDGRDSSPDSGLAYIRQIEEKITGINAIRIATVMGRYYAMDRDKRWDRIQKAYDAIVDGKGKYAASAVEAVEESYKAGITDEFIVPTIVRSFTQPSPQGGEGRGEGCLVHDNDAVIFFNFRADRARQLTRAMIEAKPVSFVTMTQYDETFALPVVFPPERLTNILGDVVSKAGLRQLRIAETEKYAHVTYFFNGGEEKVFKNEDRVLIPSPRDVPTYDKKPQMSAPQVTDEVIKRIKSGKYDVIILNYANPDMVGHTGNLNATIKAVEAVDACMGMVVGEILKVGGVALITADHGNCENMIDERGKPQTAHTLDLVPFVLAGTEKTKLAEGRALCDIAPTMLKLLGIPKPADMTGTKLF